MAREKIVGFSRRRCLAVVSIVAGVGAWLVLTSLTRMIPPAFLPPPQNIVTDFFRILGSPMWETLWSGIRWSACRSCWGIFLGAAHRIPLGNPDGVVQADRSGGGPALQLLRPIPPWPGFPSRSCGSDRDAVKIFRHLAQRLRSLRDQFLHRDPDDRAPLVKAALGWSEETARLLREVAIPRPCALSLGGSDRPGFGLDDLVAAELLASDAGLGYMMQMARRALERRSSSWGCW